MLTVGEWLGEAADLPRDECLALLREVTGLSHARVLAFPDTPLEDTQLQRLQQAHAALKTGTPLAYVLGHEDFWTLRLQVSEDVLIPRPETELLVELALQNTPHGGRVLDLGTGSGAIAIALAHSRSDLQVTATDRSAAALKVAAANARSHAVAIDFIHSDWFADISGSYHTIVCNPPYIANGDPHLPALKAEPVGALVSGADGLDDLRQVISKAPQYLVPGGMLAVEHGYDQAPAVRELMVQAGLLNVHSVKDLAQIARATLGSRQA